MTLHPKVSAIQEFSFRILPYWIAAALTALVSVLYARAFGWCEAIALQWAQADALLAFVFIPAAIVASSLLAQAFAPFSAGSGIPQLVAAVEIGRTDSPLLEKLLGLKVIFIKFVGSCVCVAGGGVTGREGPMLQVAAGIFHWIRRRWPMKDAKLDPQSMILAGGAAGLASAFNTPLGGVIFAIEELAKVHISHIRTTIFHSVLIAGLMAQAIMGNYLYIGKIVAEQSPLSEILPLAAASAVIGVLAAVFGVGIVKALDWRARQNGLTMIAMSVACGLAVAALFVWHGMDTIGSGRHVIVDLLDNSGQRADFSLGFVRALANYFTYVGGVIGGIFAPALSTGAAFGSWASQLVPGANPHVWILAGMVAFLTGVTRTPFTSLILVVEMTDSHGMLLSLMLAALFAHGAARLIDPISFYEHMAHRILAKNEEIPTK